MIRTMTLRDGRRQAWTAAGFPDGFPVLYLHGAIGSPPRRGGDLDEVIAELGLRYLMPSRPGFGLSSPSPGRTPIAYAKDVEQLADHLRLERFAVVGVSAGAPYALACAAALPSRVTRVAAVSSMTRICRPWAAAGVSRRLRVALRALHVAPGASAAVGDRAIAAIRAHPELLLRAMTLGSGAADRTLLDEPDTARIAVDGFLQATAGGVGGLIEDYRVCCAPWGFDPAEIQVPVTVWHGAQDTLVPASHALALAEAIPGAQLRVDPADGHFFFRRRVREILGGLVDTPSRTRVLDRVA